MARQTTETTLQKPAWVDRWLEVFRDTGNVRLACHACKIHRATPYQHREVSPEFAEAWKQAEEDACDLLEAEARKRARSSSDTLLIFLLKAHRPEKYREVSKTILALEGKSTDDLIALITSRPSESGS